MCCVLSHSVVSNSLRPHGLYPTRLFCPWGFSRHEYWSGLPCPSPGRLPNPGIEPRSLTLQVNSLPSESPGKFKNTGVGEWVSEVTQLCSTLCDPMDCSLLCLSVHAVSQARILEWVAYPFSRRTFRPRNRTRVSCIASRFFTSWATREAHMKCKNVNSTENYKEYK